MLTIGRVADAAGNYTVAYSGTVDVAPEGTVGFESVEATDINTIVVTFDDAFSTFDADDLVIYLTGTKKQL